MLKKKFDLVPLVEKNSRKFIKAIFYENIFQVFENVKSFNRNLSRWNVSNVKNMNWMFLNASEFNQDLNNWDVGNYIMLDIFVFNTKNPTKYYGGSPKRYIEKK